MSTEIIFYSHRAAPNPWKTTIVLEELGLPYKTIFLDFDDGENGVEGPAFIKRNPASQVPLVYDPKTGISLAESNAIAKYLVDYYDKEGMISVTSFPDKYLMDQWLQYQVSTQGITARQISLFKIQNKNQPGAMEFFQSNIKRVLKTLDNELVGKEYLVGNKCTIADLAYVNWDLMLDFGLKGDSEAATKDQREKLYPNWAAWHNRVVDRPAVQKMLKLMQEAALAT